MSARSRMKIATEVAKHIAQGGPMKGRVYLFDTIVASRRSLREARGLITAVVLLALDEYRDEIQAALEKSHRRLP